jgi:hypothetical protein
MAMTKTLIGIAVVILAAAGCSPAASWHASWHSGWSKPGMTGEVFEQDVRACDRQAMAASAGQPGHQGSATAVGRTVNPAQPTFFSAEHEKAYVDCMKGKGYTATKGN